MVIAYEDAVPELLKAFPEFQASWTEELEQWLPDVPTTDYAFGMLEAFVLDYLEEHPDDEAYLRRYLDFIELMAANSDPIVQDIVFTSFLEGIPADFIDGHLPLGPNMTRLLNEKI